MSARHGWPRWILGRGRAEGTVGLGLGGSGRQTASSDRGSGAAVEQAEDLGLQLLLVVGVRYSGRAGRQAEVARLWGCHGLMGWRGQSCS